MKLNSKEAQEYWNSMSGLDKSEFLKTNLLPYNYEPDEYELEGMINQYISNMYAKEVAFICSFLTWTNIIDNATIFASFDYYYEIAEAFIRTYPLSTKWGIENDGADYEETLESFANDYVTKHGIRI